MKEKLFTEWKSIPENVRRDGYLQERLESMKQIAEEYQKSGMKHLSYSIFKIYYETGSRKEYEHEYFGHRRILNALAILSIVYEDNDEYIKLLEDVLWGILDEFTWALPAHIPAGTPIEGCVKWIDLFAAETAFSLAEILHMLGDRLDSMVKERIEYEVRRRTLEPYLKGIKNPKDTLNNRGWDTATNNWAAVCAGSVGAAFLYLADDDEIKTALPKLKSTMSCYLDGFGDDGACVEGINYWIYGFGYFTFFAQLLYQYTDGKENYFDNEKVKKIALFQQKMRFKNNRTVTFSDCVDGFKHRRGLSHFLADKYDGMIIPDDGCATKVENDSCHRFAQAIRDFAWRTTKTVSEDADSDTFDYFENAAWYIKKTGLYEFAAKAGNNNESHNHNDIGSFLMNVQGESIITDPGRGEYTAEYFGRGRYNYFAPSALAHSIPIINGELQKDGEDYTGEIIQADNESLVIDFEKSFDNANLKKLRRKFIFRENGILLSDEFKFDTAPEGVTEHFIVSKKPSVYNDAIIIGNTLMKYNENALECKISEKTYSSGYNQNKTVYIIDLAVIKPQPDILAEIEFVCKDGEKNHE